mmetsp:Transcript_129088/g.241462  ORF Transcript_129088/g.241462 Transcript_129088/m.241462 type:complete len:88 (-) Transcript_129088:161-424(-)
MEGPLAETAATGAREDFGRASCAAAAEPVRRGLWTPGLSLGTVLLSDELDELSEVEEDDDEEDAEDEFDSSLFSVLSMLFLLRDASV